MNKKKLFIQGGKYAALQAGGEGAVAAPVTPATNPLR
jgi:hypothetical protein